MCGERNKGNLFCQQPSGAVLRRPPPADDVPAIGGGGGGIECVQTMYMHVDFRALVALVLAARCLSSGEGDVGRE